uniref:SAM domain-containing protein n=1 Tax=Branchiostoma floridae TaxID=7739 RepID=C3ZHY5_BRAFL|eukprot:XP_002591829.1 hypothetical protein BRAFLDRAFT_88773 [Branchiostoma floridae]
MPLFGPKQSKEGKRRMEHKMTLVLDLHQNRLSSVPDDIGELGTLQVLNLENNKLTSLPESVGRLQALQTLNCRENRLTDVHSAIGNLKSLRTLDLSRNRVSVLPKQLCRIKTLESLLVDVKQMVYPPAAEQSAAELVRYLMETNENVSDDSDRIDVLLDGKQQNQAALVHRMAQEEEFQKKAFEALQLEKDMKHSRITGQIALIEQQLVQLTLVEMEKKALRMDMEQEVLCQKRTALTALLVQLLEEKQTREQELKKRLVEMERHRQEEQEDYWLILYQRLLDRKPQQLVNKEAQVDIDVLKLMNGVGAEDYIPVFARHHIFTMEQLSQMSNQDLQQIGMHEFGLRQEIVSAVKKWQEEFEGKKKVPDKQDRPEASAPVPEPTAEVPPTAPEAPAAVPTAPARDTLARVITECVVCMEQNVCWRPFNSSVVQKYVVSI